MSRLIPVIGSYDLRLAVRNGFYVQPKDGRATRTDAKHYFNNARPYERCPLNGSGEDVNTWSVGGGTRLITGSEIVNHALPVTDIPVIYGEDLLAPRLQ